MIADDKVIAELTSAHHGICTRLQLYARGLTSEQVNVRIEQGLLLPFHDGVYRHAAAPWTPRARLLAAVWACGTAAVASHRSAAELHDLREVPRWRPEVTVLGPRLPRHPEITRHRTDLLEAVDRTTVQRIPVTTIPRTLLDLGAVVSYESVERAAQDAVIRNLVSAVDLICVLERVGGRGRRGTAALRAVVRASLPPKGIASQLELSLLRLIEACPIPPPVLQHEVVIDGKVYRLDAAWPPHMVAAEADGHRWHATRQEFERDLARSRALTAAGWRHLRYGWADVHQRPGAVRAELTAVLSAAVAA